MGIRVTRNFSIGLVEKQVRVAIGVLADTAAKKMEGEAKRNAPWENRTSNARNSIRSDFGWQGNKAIITLSGNMNYSVFLELANEKRYAILVPTIQGMAPEILRAYKKVVG